MKHNVIMTHEDGIRWAWLRRRDNQSVPYVEVSSADTLSNTFIHSVSPLTNPCKPRKMEHRFMPAFRVSCGPWKAGGKGNCGFHAQRRVLYPLGDTWGGRPLSKLLSLNTSEHSRSSPALSSDTDPPLSSQIHKRERESASTDTNVPSPRTFFNTVLVRRACSYYWSI